MAKRIYPIGSIVLLEGGAKRLMITGRCVGVDDSQLHDYSGVLYPEGAQGAKQFFFDESAIKQVLALGYQDAEEFAFRDQLLEQFEQLGYSDRHITPDALGLP